MAAIDGVLAKPHVVLKYWPPIPKVCQTLYYRRADFSLSLSLFSCQHALMRGDYARCCRLLAVKNSQNIRETSLTFPSYDAVSINTGINKSCVSLPPPPLRPPSHIHVIFVVVFVCFVVVVVVFGGIVAFFGFVLSVFFCFFLVFFSQFSKCGHPLSVNHDDDVMMTDRDGDTMLQKRYLSLIYCMKFKPPHH